MNLPLPDRERRFTLANALFVFYALFLAGFYFVPNAVDLYKFYVFAVFLPALLLLPATFKLAWQSLLWRAVLAYLLFMLASSLWSSSVSLEDLWRDTRYVAYILAFILLALYFHRRDSALLDGVLTAVIAVAGCAAAVSVLVSEPLLPLSAAVERRSVGFGITDNPNPSAFVYGFMAVLALDRAARWRGTPTGLLMIACFIALAVFTLMTQSNTGVLSMILACALLLLPYGQFTRLAVAAGAGLFVLAAAYLSWSLGVFGGAVDEGFSARLQIWEHVLRLWQQAPLLGNGLQVDIVLNHLGTESHLNYAHSLFLATLRDGGLLGLGLLLALFSIALREALRPILEGSGGIQLASLAFGTVVVLADVDQAITRPRELWIILWLPLALLVASELDRRRPAGAADSPGR